MPKKESRVEGYEKFNRTYTENRPFQEENLSAYIKKSKELPRLTREEIKAGIRESSYSRYTGQENPSGKIEYLNYILKPVDEAMAGYIPENFKRGVISLRDAFDMYKELAKTYESHREWEKAANSLYRAGVIARKAKAKTTANRLFEEAGVLMDKMPLTGNKDPDRSMYLRRGAAYEKMGKLSEAEIKQWKDQGNSISPNHSAEGHAVEGYELAGKYGDLARVARDNYGVGSPAHRRGLKKAGKYAELAKTYEERASQLDGGVHKEWASRYRASAEKIRKFIMKKGLDESLEQKVAAVVSLTTLVGALCFISSGITGNVIGSFTLDKTMGLGSILFIIGIITSIIYFKTKK